MTLCTLFVSLYVIGILGICLAIPRNKIICTCIDLMFEESIRTTPVDPHVRYKVLRSNGFILCYAYW